MTAKGFLVGLMTTAAAVTGLAIAPTDAQAQDTSRYSTTHQPFGDPVQPATQTQSGGYVPYTGPRNNLGVPYSQTQPPYARPDFYAACNQRDIYARWGQQVDNYIAGQLGRNDWANTFSAYGNPYARNQSAHQAQCLAVQQYYQMAYQYNGLQNVPPDIRHALDRNLYIAFEGAPREDAQRRAGYTNRRVQERLADEALRGLGIGRH